MTEREGRVVAGRYRLAGLIGHGGMGAVWHARDEALDRDVAIKWVEIGEPDSSSAAAAARRITRELMAAAKVPGTATVYDAVPADDGLWLVMELVEGQSLRDILDRDGPLSIAQAAHVAVQLLRTLNAAHAQGVLHRDVKPANILLDGDRVLLMDFGIAAFISTTTLTSTNTDIGTPQYMAPERIEGDAATRAADVWSVGVTLYEMLAGRPPFTGNSLASTLVAVVSDGPDPDPRLGELWPVIQGLLRKKPAERMTAEEAIERLLAVEDWVENWDVRITQPFGRRSSGAAPNAHVTSQQVGSLSPAAMQGFMPKPRPRKSVLVAALGLLLIGVGVFVLDVTTDLGSGRVALFVLVALAAASTVLLVRSTDTAPVRSHDHVAPQQVTQATSNTQAALERLFLKLGPPPDELRARTEPTNDKGPTGIRR